MPSHDESLRGIAERFLAAWNSQDVDSVLARYTEELAYRDPNTTGGVRGREAMRRYLTKLFAGWTMHWSLREVYPLLGGNGAAVLWHASFRRGDSETIEADGMDLVLMQGEHIARNDVYFDRSEPPRVYRRALSERGWSLCREPASTPRSCVSAQSGWSLTTPTSIPRSGRRCGRLLRS